MYDISLVVLLQELKRRLRQREKEVSNNKRNNNNNNKLLIIIIIIIIIIIYFNISPSLYGSRRHYVGQSCNHPSTSSGWGPLTELLYMKFILYYIFDNDNLH